MERCKVLLGLREKNFISFSGRFIFFLGGGGGALGYEGDLT